MNLCGCVLSWSTLDPLWVTRSQQHETWTSPSFTRWPGKGVPCQTEFPVLLGNKLIWCILFIAHWLDTHWHITLSDWFNGLPGSPTQLEKWLNKNAKPTLWNHSSSENLKSIVRRRRSYQTVWRIQQCPSALSGKRYQIVCVGCVCLPMMQPRCRSTLSG